MQLLIIEENTQIRSSLVEMLKSSSYKVHSEANSTDGVYRALNWQYEAIIVSMLSSSPSGWRTLEAIREKLSTPVLVVTTLESFENQLPTLIGGNNEYLLNTCSYRELVARLQALVLRSTGKLVNTLHIGPVTIDLVAKKVMLSGTEIQLANKQYLILVYLAQRAGTTVNSADLQRAISTGLKPIVVSNVIDVHICHIRRQLGKDFIKNIRGRGYYIPLDEE